MYESMVDVLIYLYETYMDGDTPPPTDQHTLEEELSHAGFSNSEIRHALRWLDELTHRTETETETETGSAAEGRRQVQPEAPTRPRLAGSVRIYSSEETSKLDIAAQGLLLFLEQNAILNPASRELVIERALAIEQSSISAEELKWVVLLVLMNRPGQEQAVSLMEELVYSDVPAHLH